MSLLSHHDTAEDHAEPMAPEGEVDLRASLITAATIAVGIAALHQPVAALAAFGAVLALAIARRVKPREAWHRLAHVEGFLVVLLAFLPFTTPGRAVFAIGPLTASAEGLTLGLVIALKVNTVALALLALLGGAPPEVLGRGLRGLGAPPRFARLVDLLLRHSHTARDSLRRQSEAMRARGFRMRSTPHTWRALGHLIGGALLRAFDRAERVEEAMRMRGEGARAPAPAGPMAPRARAACALTVAVMSLLLLMDRIA
jgi:cobalt/nickel transport system permease protein